MQIQIDDLKTGQSQHSSTLAELQSGQMKLHEEVHKRATGNTIWAAVGVFTTLFLAAAGGLAWWVKDQNNLLRSQVQLIVTDAFNPNSPTGSRLLDKLFAEAKSDMFTRFVAASETDQEKIMAQAGWISGKGPNGTFRDLLGQTEIYRASFAKEVLRCDRVGGSEEMIATCIDMITVPVSSIQIMSEPPKSVP